jgi:hypothetical protein
VPSYSWHDQLDGGPSHSEGSRPQRRFSTKFYRREGNQNSGVVELRETERIALLLSVHRFDPNNYPYDEHDFGSVEIGGQRFYSKIDAYDRAILSHSPNSAAL